MIDYRFQGRLTYLPGGPMNVQMSAWPLGDSGGGWWEPATGSFTCVAAYQAKGAASLAASYVNLANPGTNTAAPGVAPDFDTAYGWDFNGSSMYLTTGLIPTTDWSAIVRFSDGGTASNYLFGVQNVDTGAVYGIRPNDGFTALTYYNAGAGGTGGGSAITSGVPAIAGKTAYLNGSFHAAISAGAGTWSNPMVVGARNQHPFGISAYTAARIQAIAFYSTTLDATQVGEVTTAMAAL